MRTSLDGTPFMYMYSTLFSHLYLTIPFDKFEVDAFRELCDEFFIIAFAPKFFHHCNVTK